MSEAVKPFCWGAGLFAVLLGGCTDSDFSGLGPTGRQNLECAAVLTYDAAVARGLRTSSTQAPAYFDQAQNAELRAQWFKEKLAAAYPDEAWTSRIETLADKIAGRGPEDKEWNAIDHKCMKIQNHDPEFMTRFWAAEGEHPDGDVTIVDAR